MNTKDESHLIRWAGVEIPFELYQTPRRTLSITVRPDLTVRVSAPSSAEIGSILTKVKRRARWIIKQQRIFREYIPTTPPRQFVAGETHRYLGRQYRLKIDQGSPESVKLKGPFLRVTTPEKAERNRVRSLVKAWFADHARIAFARALKTSLSKFPSLIDSVPQLRLRAMHKRWGSCTKRGIIYLNPELVQAPPSCIDYVITHELCHLIHSNHSRAFYAVLQTIMPDWQSRKTRLERSVV